MTGTGDHSAGEAAALRGENARLREQVMRMLRIEAELFHRNELLDAQGKVYRALSELGRRFNAGVGPAEIAAESIRFALYSVNLERAVFLGRDGARVRSLAHDGYYDEQQARAIAALDLDAGDPRLAGSAPGELRRIRPLAQSPGERDETGALFDLDEYAVFPLKDSDGSALAALVVGNTARKAQHHARLVADEGVALALQNLVDLACAALRGARFRDALAAEKAQLEARVAERTAELAVELEERQRAEQARAELQDEIIRAQTARLEELSTPILPIAEQIVVMPLIGGMDAARAEQMKEAALMASARHGARFVIIDITGVKAVDAACARALADTASGLRLLGAHVVLTGIQPAVAQTLVNLDLDLDALVTRGNLRAGFAYAMARLAARG